jgi:hypothetical protein
MERIESLTAEQDALLPEYRSRWQQMATATGRLDASVVRSAITTAYDIIQCPVPDIQLYPSPQAVFEKLLSLDIVTWDARAIEDLLLKPLIEQLQGQVSIPLWAQAREQLYRQIFLHLKQPKQQMQFAIRDNLLSQHRLGRDSDDKIHRSMVQRIRFNYSHNPEEWFGFCAMADFLINVVGCSYDTTPWQILSTLSGFYGWTFVTYQPVIADRPLCLVSERPQF